VLELDHREQSAPSPVVHSLLPALPLVDPKEAAEGGVTAGSVNQV